MESQKSQLAQQELLTQLLSMGADVEKAILTIQNLMIQFSDKDFNQLFLLESLINERHLKIDKLCVELIAKYSPKASDLRKVFAISKTNSDLERMGDQCRNCAFILRDIHKTKENIDFSWKALSEMMSLVGNMVKSSLDGFSMLEDSKMKEVLQKDDRVDCIKNDIFLQCKSKMIETPERIDFFLDIIMLAKNIERIGDHATNVAEDVIYVCTGADIRHGGLKEDV